MPSQREEAGLSGPVRSVRTDVIQFELTAGKLVEKPWYHSTVDYDAHGRATAQVTHNANGTVNRALHQYDSAGRLAETRTELDGVNAGRTVYLYDTDGRLTYELSLRADGSEGRQTRRIYDADGSYTEEFTVDPEPGAAALTPVEGPENPAHPERASFIRSRRDATGRPLEMRFYDPTGDLLYRFVYHYNAAGRLTDMEQRTGDTPLFDLSPGTEVAAALRQEFAALFSPDTALSTVRYRYDEHGRRTEAATWMGAHCIDRRTFAYNDRGDQTEERRYGPDGLLQTENFHEREYDAHGNWISEMISVRDGNEKLPQPSSLTRRIIEY